MRRVSLLLVLLAALVAGGWPPAVAAETCLNGSGTSTEDREGCLDSDGDGWSDPDPGWAAHPEGEADAFVNEPTQWLDLDGDGWGDNLSTGAALRDWWPQNDEVHDPVVRVSCEVAGHEVDFEGRATFRCNVFNPMPASGVQVVASWSIGRGVGGTTSSALLDLAAEGRDGSSALVALDVRGIEAGTWPVVLSIDMADEDRLLEQESLSLVVAAEVVAPVVTDENDTGVADAVERFDDSLWMLQRQIETWSGRDLPGIVRFAPLVLASLLVILVAGRVLRPKVVIEADTSALTPRQRRKRQIAELREQRRSRKAAIGGAKAARWGLASGAAVEAAPPTAAAANSSAVAAAAAASSQGEPGGRVDVSLLEAFGGDDDEDDGLDTGDPLSGDASGGSTDGPSGRRMARAAREAARAAGDEDYVPRQRGGLAALVGRLPIARRIFAADVPGAAPAGGPTQAELDAAEEERIMMENMMMNQDPMAAALGLPPMGAGAFTKDVEAHDGKTVAQLAREAEEAAVAQARAPSVPARTAAAPGPAAAVSTVPPTAAATGPAPVVVTAGGAPPGSIAPPLPPSSIAAAADDPSDFIPRRNAALASAISAIGHQD